MIVVEKLLTELAMPNGVLWLGLMAASLLAWRRKQKAILAALVVLLALHTAAGSKLLGTTLMGWLEQDYAQVQPLDEGPYDAIVLLGGGTSTGTNGQSQLNWSGDRVALAAQLHHAGCTSRVIVTGQRIESIHPDGRDCAEESADILRRLGVPEDNIVQLSGRNTREEMAALVQWTAEHPESKRLGLVTSAWHMRRALQLARERDLDFEPLPADFQGDRSQWNMLWFIPSADGNLKTQLACKEILAALVGR